MKKYLYLVLVLIGLGFLLAIPLHAAESSLQVTINNVPSGSIYPSQFDILALDFTVNPLNDDKLEALLIEIKGTVYVTYIQGATLYADDGDGIFQGWQKDISLGSGSFIYDYQAIQSWYWQDLDFTVKSSGQKFFIALETVFNSNISEDNKLVQVAIPAFNDNNSDGIFDPVADAGIFMSSGQNGPGSEIINSDLLVLKKNNLDYYAPVSLITVPGDDDNVSSKQLLISGLSREQGGGSIFDVFVTIKDSQSNILVEKAKSSITDQDLGAWQYDYTFPIEGSYTVISQAIDSNGNLETPGDSVTITIGEPIIPEEPVVPEEPTPGYTHGDLIKASGAAVYYFGHDNKRYVFPNLGTYLTWYPDFSGVVTTTDLDLGTITIGGNVTYRPGVKLVKITTDPKVYAVDSHGTLRWISTEALAVALYGVNWGSLVEDVPDPFFINYFVGEPINFASQFSPERATNAATDISADKGLYPQAPIL